MSFHTEKVLSPVECTCSRVHLLLAVADDAAASTGRPLSIISTVADPQCTAFVLVSV